MKKLKTVVAGLGRIGWQFHLPGVLKHEGFILTGVCDPVKDRLKEAEELFSVTGYTDYFEMLDSEKPDLVVIASPTHVHAEQAIGAMERGCDVFLDKPMALNLDEADKIIEVRKRTGRKLMVYQPHRATAETQTLMSIIQRGIIGPIYMMKGASSQYVFRNDWQAFKKYGGGMLNNYGAHLIDKLIYLSGSPAKRINGHMYKIASAGDADDVVKMLIETENKITIDLDINMATAINLPGIMIFGQYGTIISGHDDGGSFYRIRYYDPKEQTEVVASDSLAAADRKYVTASPVGWKEEIVRVDKSAAINFYEKCYGYYALDESPFVPVCETRNVMRLMQECRADAGWME